MDKLSPINLNLRKDTIRQNAFNGSTFDSFKTPQKLRTAVPLKQPQADTFANPKAPQAKSNLKNLVNIIPDSYADEIFVGAVTVALAAFAVVRGRGKNANDVLSALGFERKMNDIQGTLTDLQDDLAAKAK